MEDVLIPVTILGFFFLLFGFVVLMRYINYRETMTLAEKGLVRPDGLRNGNGKDTLRWGIVIAALGLALCVGLYPLGFTGNSRWLLGLGPWMLAGLLPLFFGVGLILVYLVSRDEGGQAARREAERSARGETRGE
jgi:hypothetical protein